MVRIPISPRISLVVVNPERWGERWVVGLVGTLGMWWRAVVPRAAVYCPCDHQEWVYLISLDTTMAI